MHMPSRRNDNKKFIDRFLGMFGFRRPVRSNRTRRSDFARLPEQEHQMLMDDDFKVRLSDDYTREVPIVRDSRTAGRAGQSSRRSRPDAQKKATSRRRTTERLAHMRRDPAEDLTAQESEAFPILGENFEILQPARTQTHTAGGTRSAIRSQKGDKRSKKTKKKSVWRTVGRVALSLFLVGVISFCLIVGAFMVYVFAFVDNTVDNNLNDLTLNYTTVLYAQDGDKQVEIGRLHGEENRVWVGLEEMPVMLQHAFVAIEDKRFYDHDGVDWKRTFSAFANLLFHFWDSDQGGSTITQQLVKNLTNDNETAGVEGIMRKVREIMRARYLEGEYSKDTILECYLNTIHLGNGVDGVEVASNYYFDKKTSELTLVQCAALAAITREPSLYEPYGHPDKNKSRRNLVLNEMCDQGYITEEERDEAKAADIELRDTPSTTLSRTDRIEEEYNSWFVDTVIEQVIDDLMETQDLNEETAEQRLYTGGYHIYTTMDLDIQNRMETAFKNDNNFMKVRSDSGDSPQAAMTIIDYEGHVLGVVGGRGEKEGNRLFNRATSPRQTGSAIKPITCYAPALEYNLITYASYMRDGPVTELANGASPPDSPWPKNYSGYYSGNVSVLYALEQSLNTIPVKLVQELGLQRSYDFATKKLGISTFVESVEVDGDIKTDLGESSLALGGSVYGATTMDMAAAYAAFGNLGKYWEPTTYYRVMDQKQENVILQQQDRPTTAMGEDTANIMCEMLQLVTRDGTGSGARFGNWEIMSKTGTSSGTKERWFVGATPYYVGVVMFGLDNHEDMRGLYSNPALRLWNAVMPYIHEDLETKKFPESDDCVYKRYCLTSGKVAVSGCTNTAYGWFKKDYQPACTTHYGSIVDDAEKPA